MDLPDDDLRELASILDSGDLKPLRDRFDYPRRVRRPLERYTDRIYLFPFGIHPDLSAPIQVFRNGLGIWMGEEAQVLKVGAIHPVSVCVLDHPAGTREQIQATYTAVPEVGR